MFEAKCYDVDGNSIDGFTQWDIDQQITIKLEGCGNDHASVGNEYFSIAPEVHFSNVKRNSALVVKATVVDNFTIAVQVPNVLLMEPFPLLIYVYITNNRDVSAQKTIVHVELPIRRRNEPDDYWYVENIERITAEMIKKEIEFDTENTRTEAIKAITDTKNEAIGIVNNTKSEAIRSILDTKNEAETFVTNTKNEAAEFIAKTKDDAEAFIVAKKEDFVNTGNAIVSEANTIKNDTNTIYMNTVKVAENTRQEIVNDINRLMFENGMELHSTDDGDGNVTTTVVVRKV